MKMEEIQVLKQFIGCQVFNDGKRPQKVELLLHYLIRLHPEFPDADLAEAVVFASVFPGEAYKKSKLDNVNSEAVKVVRKFIAVCLSDQNHDFQYWLSQVRFFRQRDIETDFLNAVENAQKVLEEETYKDQNYFLNLFEIETEKIRYLSKINDKKSDIQLPAAIRNLDLFYVISKLEYSSYLLTRNNSTFLNIESTDALLEEVLKVAKENYNKLPILAANYFSYALLSRQKQGNIEDYFRLKQLLEKEAGQFSVESLRSLHGNIRSYLSYRYNTGDSDCLSELFSLIKDQVQQKTIYHDGYHILASTLQNAVTVALKLNETEWAFDFLKQHEHRINGADDSKSMFHFNLANVLFHQGKYMEAEQFLDKFHFREMFYNLAVRRLDIKLQFETGTQLDVLKYRLDALKNLVHEQKKLLQTDKFEANNNFVKTMLKVHTILRDDEKTRFTKMSPIANRQKRIEILLSQIKQEPIVAEREWLLKILEALCIGKPVFPVKHPDV
jgi:hypothetical protein